MVDRTPDDEAGNLDRSAAEILPLVYTELRRLARARMAKVPPGNTLQPTDLVHEAYVRLARGGQRRWDSRGHFFSAASEAMRRILVEQARRKATPKHGGDLERVDIDDVDVEFTMPVDDVLALDRAIARLSEEDPRKARIVVLRCFAGLPRDEIAAALGVSVPTIDREWRYIGARIRQELSGFDDSPEH